MEELTVKRRKYERKTETHRKQDLERRREMSTIFLVYIKVKVFRSRTRKGYRGERRRIGKSTSIRAGVEGKGRA